MRRKPTGWTWRIDERPAAITVKAGEKKAGVNGLGKGRKNNEMQMRM
jgi:hypothetical protein